LRRGRGLEDAAGTLQAHPTLGDGFQEAALEVLGRALQG
jgi:dihydrolipoamide dehydrogenase